MTKDSELLESIDHRLKMLLKLRVENKLEECDTNKEQVKILHEMGFDTQETADLIGTSSGSVRASLSQLRKDGDIDG